MQPGNECQTRSTERLDQFNHLASLENVRLIDSLTQSEEIWRTHFTFTSVLWFCQDDDQRLVVMCYCYCVLDRMRGGTPTGHFVSHACVLLPCCLLPIQLGILLLDSSWNLDITVGRTHAHATCSCTGTPGMFFSMVT